VPTTTLSSKGQLVIPLEIRRRLGLEAGAKLRCELEDDRIVLEPEHRGPAVLERDADGLPVLVATADAPEMTPEIVKEILSNFP